MVTPLTFVVAWEGEEAVDGCPEKKKRTLLGTRSQGGLKRGGGF